MGTVMGRSYIIESRDSEDVTWSRREGVVVTVFVFLHPTTMNIFRSRQPFPRQPFVH